MADTAVPHALTERSALEASASVHDVPSSDPAQKMSGCSHKRNLAVWRLTNVVFSCFGQADIE